MGECWKRKEHASSHPHNSKKRLVRELQQKQTVRGAPLLTLPKRGVRAILANATP
jgi:hypothetical protein